MKYFALVLSTLFLGIAPVWAVPPEVGTYTFHYESCPDGGPVIPLYDCGDGFYLCETDDLDGMYKFFLDKDSEPVRYWEQVRAAGVVFELGNPDNFLPWTAANFTFEYDYVENLSTYAGNYGMIIVPGYGQIFRDVGRISGEGLGVFPPYIFYAGDHQWFDVVYGGEDDLEPVCDYLASQ